MKHVCPCCGKEVEVGVLGRIKEALGKIYDYVLDKLAELINDVYGMRLGTDCYERIEWWEDLNEDAERS